MLRLLFMESEKGTRNYDIALVQGCGNRPVPRNAQLLKLPFPPGCRHNFQLAVRLCDSKLATPVGNSPLIKLRATELTQLDTLQCFAGCNRLRPRQY